MAKTIGYESATVREQHIHISLSQFDIPHDVDTAVITVHYTRGGGRSASKTIRLSSFDLEEVRRAL